MWTEIYKHLEEAGFKRAPRLGSWAISPPEPQPGFPMLQTRPRPPSPIHTRGIGYPAF